MVFWISAEKTRAVSVTFMTEFDIKSNLRSMPAARLRELQKSLNDEIKARRVPPGKLRRVITYTDGASRGNPGPAGIGILIYNERDQKLLQDYEFIGETTNNEAEYRALLLALERAYELTQERVDCFMD